MLIKSRRERILVGLTLLVTVLGLGYVGYLKYEEKWTGLQEDLSSLQREYSAMVRILINLKSIMARYQRVTEDLRLPGEESLRVIQIRDEIDRFLEKAEITSKGRINPEEPEYHDDVGAVAYRFQIDDLTTTMPRLARFLSLLEEESAVLEVKELDVQPSDRRRGGNYGVRVRMRISRIVFTESRAEVGV
jgi:hypothetical protein